MELNVQYEFRRNRGRIDPLFSVRQVCKKDVANGNDVCWTLDLEIVYDAIDRRAMWQMLTVYGVRDKLLKAVHR